MQAVVLASRNAGKAREFGELFRGAFSVLPLPATMDMPAETGASFAENARMKAEHAFCALGGGAAVLADDSGLWVAALGGRPACARPATPAPAAAGSGRTSPGRTPPG